MNLSSNAVQGEVPTPGGALLSAPPLRRLVDCLAMAPGSSMPQLQYVCAHVWCVCPPCPGASLAQLCVFCTARVMCAARLLFPVCMPCTACVL